METLRSRLAFEPRELRFGTSGRRGLVADLTQLEIYINATAEIEYLLSLDRAQGGIAAGDEFYFAFDLRPSSPAIAQAIVAALRDAGLGPVNMGRIPTPALASYAVARRRGSMMVTGSHIPFDRNGYKTNTSTGELSKESEEPIGRRVESVRARLYSQPFGQSLFDEQGRLRNPPTLPAEQNGARDAYIDRYTSFFGPAALAGWRLLVYQHSAVGRDLLPEILVRCGARVTAAGRSDTFIAIDTEHITADQLSAVQALADGARAAHGALDAVVSTDGDSDRPLILGVEPRSGAVRFYGGDLVGMVVAGYLEADAVVVPVSANDGIDRGPLAAVIEPKTRIGSPYVIAGMERARRKGRRRVCGWEANGGFLLGSDIERGGKRLAALPTRDAILPILGVLCAAREKGLALAELFARLPRRFSRAALLANFPRPAGLRIVEFLSHHANAAAFFAEAGFPDVAAIDLTDGARVAFINGEVVHIRPSGNADELRIYAVADTEARAGEIAALGVAEPDGILRQLERRTAG